MTVIWYNLRLSKAPLRLCLCYGLNFLWFEKFQVSLSQIHYQSQLFYIVRSALAVYHMLANIACFWLSDSGRVKKKQGRG